MHTLQITEKTVSNEIHNSIQNIESLLLHEAINPNIKEIIVTWIQEIKKIQNIINKYYISDSVEQKQEIIKEAYADVFLLGASVSQSIWHDHSTTTVWYPINKQTSNIAQLLLQEHPELKNITLHKEVNDLIEQISGFDTATANYMQKLYRQLREDFQKRAHNPMHALVASWGKIFDELTKVKDNSEKWHEEHLINQGWKYLYAIYLIYTTLNNPEVKKLSLMSQKEKQQKMTEANQKKVQSITDNPFFQIYSEQQENTNEITFYPDWEAFQEAFEKYIEIHVLIKDIKENNKTIINSSQKDLSILVNTVKIYFEKYSDIDTKDILKNAGLKNKQQQDKARKTLKSFIDKNIKSSHQSTRELAQFLKHIISN